MRSKEFCMAEVVAGFEWNFQGGMMRYRAHPSADSRALQKPTKALTCTLVYSYQQEIWVVSSNRFRAFFLNRSDSTKSHEMAQDQRRFVDSYASYFHGNFSSWTRL